LPDRVDPENGPVTVSLTSKLSDFVYFYDSQFLIMAPIDLPAVRVEKVTFNISDSVHTITYYNFTIKVLPVPIKNIYIQAKFSNKDITEYLSSNT
jgi:hypothetical protein